jgi:hypothetical protein
MNLKDKTICVVDNGLFVSFARTLAKEFGRVLYHKPFQSAFVSTNDIAPGQGFEEIEWCKQPLALLGATPEEDEIDLWVFLDLYQGGLQEFLRATGRRVWGSGMGEELELLRWEFKQHLKDLGLPVQKMERIYGMDQLREHLKKVDNKFVKTSFVRGDFETFHHDTYELTEPRLDDISHQLGPMKENYEFIVEDEIPDAVEVGYDGYTVDGKYPNLAMMGYEIKDCGMIATVKPYDMLAEPVRKINAAMVNDFKGYKYRGFFATEIRYTKDKKSYFLDPCCRLGTPSNELLQELFDGWGQVLWDGAEGKITTPRKKANYGVLAMIYSEFAVKDWLCLHYPEDLDEHVKLRFHARINGKNYIVPQPIGIPDVGAVVGTGETLQAAIKQCKERAEQVKGYQVNVNLHSIDRAMEVIAKGEKFGVKF